jgi:hypothetical protein
MGKLNKEHVKDIQQRVFYEENMKRLRSKERGDGSYEA